MMILLIRIIVVLKIIEIKMLLEQCIYNHASITFNFSDLDIMFIYI